MLENLTVLTNDGYLIELLKINCNAWKNLTVWTNEFCRVKLLVYKALVHCEQTDVWCYIVSVI